VRARSFLHKPAVSIVLSKRATLITYLAWPSVQIWKAPPNRKDTIKPLIQKRQRHLVEPKQCAFYYRCILYLYRRIRYVVSLLIEEELCQTLQWIIISACFFVSSSVPRGMVSSEYRSDAEQHDQHNFHNRHTIFNQQIQLQSIHHGTIFFRSGLCR
jgi:hypothetical protein